MKKMQNHTILNKLNKTKKGREREKNAGIRNVGRNENNSSPSSRNFSAFFGSKPSRATNPFSYSLCLYIISEKYPPGVALPPEQRYLEAFWLLLPKYAEIDVLSNFFFFPPFQSLSYRRRLLLRAIFPGRSCQQFSLWAAENGVEGEGQKCHYSISHLKRNLTGVHKTIHASK